MVHVIKCKLLPIACKVLHDLASAYFYISAFFQLFHKYLWVPTMFKVNKTDKNPCPDILVSQPDNKQDKKVK